MKSHFGAALDRLIRGSGLSLHEAGKHLGQFHTVLSTVTRGASVCSRRNLSILLTCLRRNHRKFGLTSVEARDVALRLHTAWMEDFILPEYEGLIGVVARQEPPAPATDPRAAALSFFEGASLSTPEVADWLIATRSLMRDALAHKAPKHERTPKKARPSAGKKSG